MYKYVASRTVTGTPFAIVNGVILNDFPETADEWMKMLKDVYNSQYPKHDPVETSTEL